MKYRIDIVPSGNDARVYLRYCHKDVTGKTVKDTYRKCGRLSELLASDPQAIEVLKKEVGELNEALERQRVEALKAINNSPIPPEIAKACRRHQRLTGGEPIALSLGMVPLNRIWNDLGLQYLFDYLKRSGYKIEYDLADIVRQLTLLRVLKPASKMKSCEKLSHRYMTGFDMEKTQAYRCLDVLDECKEDVVRILNSRLAKLIPERKTSVCLYDITTFAFESTDVDTLRDFGYSKL